MKATLSLALRSLLALTLGAGLALAHEIDIPGAVETDGLGHFSYEVTVTVTEPIEFGFAYVNGTDNTNLGEMWYDGFCLEVLEPGVYPWPIEGDLVDTGADGSVYFEHNLCDNWTGVGTTIILAPTVAAEAESWSAVRARYR